MPPKRRKKTKKPNKVTKSILIKDHPEFKKIEKAPSKKPLTRRRGLANFKKDLYVFHPLGCLHWRSAQNHALCEQRLEDGKLCNEYAPWYCQTCNKRICDKHSKLHYATKT